MRPGKQYTTGPILRTLRILALLGAVVVTCWVLVLYSSLPDMVPTHFDLRGRPDDVGDRSSVLVVAALMVALTVFLAWLSARPRMLNYPVAVTEHNAQRLYRESERMLVATLLGLQAIYLGIVLSITGSGGGGASTPIIVIGVLVMVGAVLVGVIRLARAG